jgi:phosphoribosylaminoimidazolecarboxamide formyltransferase/IMP cyclohydrolase
LTGAPQAENEYALRRMVEGDTRAIFGGFVMVNFEIDADLAQILIAYAMPSGQRRLLDGIVAPGFTPEAIAYLKRKGDKCRLLANPALAHLSRDSLDQARRLRQVRGGFLAQPNYTFVLVFEHVQHPPVDPLPGQLAIDVRIYEDAMLAWAVGSTSNSNTIALVKDGMLIGNGVGQQDRVGAAQLALQRACDAHHDVHGAVAYSDSFFPFPDGPTVLAKAGIKAIMASSGSLRDKEVRQACAELGVTLLMIPDAEARGFYGH